MWRYVLIATAIVFVVGGIAAAVHQVTRDLNVKSVQSTGSPSPPRHQAPSTFTPGPITGEAPWAFDALIDCFHHARTFRGTLESVRTHIPATAKPIAPHRVLQSGPCFAVVDGASAGGRVQRGPSAHPGVLVAIPPHLELFTEGGPSDPAIRGVRTLYVLRWKVADDARLDRLTTMADSRIGAVQI